MQELDELLQDLEGNKLSSKQVPAPAPAPRLSTATYSQVSDPTVPMAAPLLSPPRYSMAPAVS
jgi:hypothetical protein